ncbi:hypothetical protein [Desulfogranum japonicum]|uniref:hypothetical protein n=1 Tax=Desulfogranum japonicum TaxID=231447 RepID=UPI000425C6FF|nr:hypothetical protein [Desulfogranum japonicum]
MATSEQPDNGHGIQATTVTWRTRNPKEILGSVHLFAYSITAAGNGANDSYFSSE